MIRACLFVSLLALLSAAKAENIVNGSFESWTGGVPDNPIGWTTSNVSAVNFNVTKDTDRHGGSFSAKGTVNTAGSTAYVNSTLDTLSHAYVYLNYWYKCNLVSGDIFSLSGVVYKSDGSSAVGTISHNVNANSTVWKPASIAISYFSSPAARAIVNFTITNSSGVHAGSYFLIDDVTMSDVSIGINEIEETPALEVYPNPFHDYLKIKTTASTPLQIVLSDALGKTVLQRLSAMPSNGILQETISAESLSSGLYFLMLTGDKKTLFRRVVIE